MPDRFRAVNYFRGIDTAQKRLPKKVIRRLYHKQFPQATPADFEKFYQAIGQWLQGKWREAKSFWRDFARK